MPQPSAAPRRRVPVIPGVDLDEFPRIGHPAVRALREAGFQNLRQLADVSRRSLARLDNVGPKSLGLIQASLQQHGMTLR